MTEQKPNLSTKKEIPASTFRLGIWIALSIGCLFATGGYASLALRNPSWQCLTLASLYGFIAVLSVVNVVQLWRPVRKALDMRWLVSLLALAFILQSVFIQGAGLLSAVFFIIVSLIASSLATSQKSGTATILLGLIASAVMSLAGVFSPFQEIQAPQVVLALLVALVVLIMVFIGFVAKGSIASTLQLRLTTAFISIAVISLVVATIVQTQVSINKLRESISTTVLVTSAQVAENVDQFFKSNTQTAQQVAQLDPLVKYLEAHHRKKVTEQEELDARSVFKTLTFSESNEQVFLTSYALLDLQGVDILDSTERNIGSFEGEEPHFTQPMRTSSIYVSDVVFTPSGASYIYFSAPVVNNQRETVGIFRIRYNALVLQRLLETYSGLMGVNSHAMLFDEYQIRLADTYTSDMVYSSLVELSPLQAEELAAHRRLPTVQESVRVAGLPDLSQALYRSTQSPSFYLDLEAGKKGDETSKLSEIGGISPMTVKPWKVVYIQAAFDDTALRESQVGVATLIATLIAVAVGFLSVGLSNILSAPIVLLTKTAEQISQGDLDARADVKGNDEFSTLGKAFNHMTFRLRELIADLENRVAQRTLEITQRNDELVYRARQLETVAEVARNIVTSQELQSLLDSVTHLISERFGFYHVGVFLVDENRENAVLRAANSEGGQRMLARQHMLRIGKTGIVGYVTDVGEARIATDVGTDSVFFNNPDLPLTRSEMALPLKVNEQIIGALDVQSTESDAFSPDDVELFSTLADQVAIAIHNNRLYAETARALEEAQRTHRQYLRQEWDSELTKRQNRAFLYTPQGPTIKQIPPTQVEANLASGEPVVIEERLPDETVRAVMAVPISVRGELIGVIRLQDHGANRSWSEDERQAVKEIAQQVGVALESARLLEKTIHRAEREKKVLEITGMIRATNDPQQMLEIAAAELQKALGVTQTQVFIRKPTSPLNQDVGQPSQEKAPAKKGGNGRSAAT